jgi:hypothetical protein
MNNSVKTYYRDRLFRSRLEARWAAFFDLCGWGWEYEPSEFTSSNWLPDFAILGAEGPILTEVKPIDRFDQAVADRIDRAVPVLLGRTDKDPTVYKFEALLLGVRPLLMADEYPSDFQLGWLRDDLGAWGQAELGRWVGSEYVRGQWKGEGHKAHDQIGFRHEYNSFHDRITGRYDGGCRGDLELKRAEIDQLWAEATNVVQWKRR